MKIILLLSVIFLLSCQQTIKNEMEDRLEKQEKELKQKIVEAKESAQKSQEEARKKSLTPSKYHSESFETPNVGWGYSIFEGTKEIIHQPHIPAIQGNQGFATKEISDRVAKEIIKKLDQGIMPPTLSIDEMRKLGAI